MRGLGRSGEALKMLEKLKSASRESYVSPYALGLAYLGADYPKEALEYLDTAVQDHAGGIQFLAVDPIFDELRKNAAFDGVVQKLGLHSPSD